MNMNQKRTISRKALLATLALLVSLPNLAFATKHVSKKTEAGTTTHRPSATIANESKPVPVRISVRKVHGVHSLSRPDSRVTSAHPASHRYLPSQEQSLDAARIRVLDGETFAYGVEKVRIQGFVGQSGSSIRSREARQRLEDILGRGQITIVPYRLDRSGNLIAEVRVEHQNIVELLSAYR